MRLSIFNLQINYFFCLTTLYQYGTLSQLQLNLHNHVLDLCALCKELFVSLPGSMPCTLSSNVPSGIWDSTPIVSLRLRMNSSFSLWLIKSKSNSSYSIMATISSETKSGSINDIEDNSAYFMEVTLSFIEVLSP
jgi:hypothetical protein